MGWLGRFLTSSIGQKLLMSLTGIFLILFLVVHLAGNFQLLMNDEGKAFNIYADFMSNNGLIQIISKGNFFFILLHAILGLYLWAVNKAARGGQKYAVTKVRATNTHPGFARNMAILGTIMLVFILIHLYQFWLQMKLGVVANVSYAGGPEIADLYEKVKVAFMNPGFVVFYVISMVVIAFHLWHGFQSAFQTLGLNHRKYTPFIQFLGKAYSILIPFGYAIIPIIFYLKNS
ncbi:MAG: succinate dehydrogenase cytochrome b subunit [Bacteroidota bacterium]